MKEITREDAQDYALKLMFKIKDEEIDNLVDEFKIMAKQVEVLTKIKGLETIEPMTFPFVNEEADFREDAITRTINREDAFSNCKDVEDYEVRVPKVVGE